MGFAGDVAETVDERHVGGVEELGRGFHCFVDRGLLAVDECIVRHSAVWFLNHAPPAENAGVVSFRQIASVIGVQFDVVADAAAERTRRVLHHVQLHQPLRLFRLSVPLPSELDGTRDARPRKLPRMRRRA